MVMQQHDAPQRSLLVEMWSDLICPWCRIGEKHFEKALAMYEHRDSVRVVLRSYRLMPGSETVPVEQVMRDKYRLQPDEIIQSFAGIEATAQGVGLRYQLGGSWAGDTMDAHRLVKFAETVGKKQALFNRLYAAAMSKQRRIPDHAVLRELALAEGLSDADIDSVLASDAYRNEVEADEKSMKGYGGNGVPFFVIGGKYTYSGAVSPDILLGALNKAWQESFGASGDGVGKKPTQQGEGGILCGPEGCKLS